MEKNMLLIIGTLSVLLGLYLEKQTGYISKLRATKFGKAYLADSKSLIFTEMIILMVFALVIKLLNVTVTQFDIMSGIVVGQLIVIALVANGRLKKK